MHFVRLFALAMLTVIPVFAWAQDAGTTSRSLTIEVKPLLERGAPDAPWLPELTLVTAHEASKVDRAEPEGVEVYYVLSGAAELEGVARAEAGDAIVLGSAKAVKVQRTRTEPVRLLVASRLAAPEAEASGQEAVATAKSAKTFPVANGKGRATLLHTAANKAVYVGRLKLMAGGVVPEHVHPQETELLYVLGGEGDLTIAGKKQVVRKGMAIRIPPNTPHAFRVTSKAAVDAVQFYSPAGPEERFRPK